VPAGARTRRDRCRHGSGKGRDRCRHGAVKDRWIEVDGSIVGLFDLYQQHQIRRTNQWVTLDEGHNVQRYRRNRDGIDEVDARIDRLLLATEAIWQLVAERTDLTDGELGARMTELDLLDGEENRRRLPLPRPCSCGAKVNPKVERCQYCGEPSPKRSLFDTI
jgi:hypothetical protein